jgi:hypothetical protein
MPAKTIARTQERNLTMLAVSSSDASDRAADPAYSGFNQLTSQSERSRQNSNL